MRARSQRFRDGFVSRLRRAFEDGRLPHTTDRREVDRVRNPLMGAEWMVFSTSGLTRTDSVVEYLGAATAIALRSRIGLRW